MLTGFVMRRVAVALICGLLAALVCMYGYSGHTAAKAAQAKVQALGSALLNQTKARTADAEAFRISGITKAAVFVAKENTDVEVTKAVLSEPVWAGAMVPSSVLDAAGM